MYIYKHVKWLKDFRSIIIQIISCTGHSVEASQLQKLSAILAQLGWINHLCPPIAQLEKLNLLFSLSSSCAWGLVIIQKYVRAVR